MPSSDQIGIELRLQLLTRLFHSACQIMISPASQTMIAPRRSLELRPHKQVDSFSNSRRFDFPQVIWAPLPSFPTPEVTWQEADDFLRVPEVPMLRQIRRATRLTESKTDNERHLLEMSSSFHPDFFIFADFTGLIFPLELHYDTGENLSRLPLVNLVRNLRCFIKGNYV